MSISYGDKVIANLRSLVTVIERELASTTAPEELRAAWTQMVDALALGAAPDLRECPSCGEVGMRAATRCMRCWSRLAVLPTATAAAHAAGS